MKKSLGDKERLIGYAVSVSEALSQIVQLGVFGNDLAAMNKAKAASNMVIEYIRLALNYGAENIEQLVIPDSIRIKIENEAAKSEQRLKRIGVSAVPESWKTLVDKSKANGEVEMLDKALSKAIQAVDDFIHDKDVQNPDVDTPDINVEDMVAVDEFLDKTESEINKVVEANLIAAYTSGRIPKL
ncbi:MAG: hypothetical protein D6732_10850 [Methanobacteriota archaeon]|nr:MAG: hypothetical protein D6732_10850 [Euryarchaeota archaeon]